MLSLVSQWMPGTCISIYFSNDRCQPHKELYQTHTGLVCVLAVWQASFKLHYKATANADLLSVCCRSTRSRGGQ